MKLFSGLILLAAALAVVGGCSSGDNASATDNKAFTTHDKTATQGGPPAGATTAPKDFKSSIDGPKPGGGAPVPGAGG